MQFTTVRSQENDYDIYLKSEKLVHSQQEYEKSVSQLFGSKNKLVPSSFEPNKHCCSYLEREKSGSLLFGEQKMQFTNVRSKEKDYDIYLKFRKTCSQPVGARKKCFPAIQKWKKLVSSFSSMTNTVAAIWREKKLDPCYLETKKCSSQLLGARKKIMTSI